MFPAAMVEGIWQKTSAQHKPNIRMATPTVVQFDHDAPPMPLSPMVDYMGRTTHDKGSQKDKDPSTPRKQVVEMKNYKEIKQKYQGAKKRVDRLKQERENNKRMLLEMSSVISALKEISIDYEPVPLISDHNDPKDRSGHILNIHSKIRAVDTQLKTAMIHCGNLEQEKVLQSSTIVAQQQQIKAMEEQMNILRQQLADAEKEEYLFSNTSETKSLDMIDGNSEVTSCEAEERTTAELENQMRYNSFDDKNNNIQSQIVAFQGSHKTKYAEIQAMERQLEVLREAQRDRLSELASNKNSKPVKHVTFTPDAMQFKFDRVKSRSHSSGSSHETSSSTYNSSLSDQQPALELTSEEEDDEESRSVTSDSVDPEVFADDRGANYSLRSAVTAGGGDENSSRIKVVIVGCDASCEEESVEITMNKDSSDPFAEESFTSEETVSSQSPDTSIDYAVEYNRTTVKLMELKLENENLRKNHGHALANMARISELTSEVASTKNDYEELKRVVEEQKQSTTLAQTKYLKLVQQHGKTLEDLNEERAKYEQLLEDNSKASHRESEIHSYNELKETYNKVVAKMADVAEENERLLMERNEAWKERDQAQSNASRLATETESINKGCKDLQDQNDAMIRKVSALSITCDEYKTKYYELLARDHQNMTSEPTHDRDERYEMLRREYESVLEKLREVETGATSLAKLHRANTEALEKIATLEKANEGLKDLRTKYHAAEAKIVMLQLGTTKGEEEAQMAKRREEQRSLQLKDMLTHYKTLEAEHEEVCQKLMRMGAVLPKENGALHQIDQGLKLGPAGLGALADQAKAAAYHSKMAAFEKRIKGLQQQRDAAVEQMNQLEELLRQSRLEKSEAVQSRKEREQDLKVVLGHYRALQKAHDELKSKTERLEHELSIEQSHHTGLAVLAEKDPEAHRSEIFNPSIYHSVNGENKNERNETEDGDLDMISESRHKDTGKVALVDPSTPPAHQGRENVMRDEIGPIPQSSKPFSPYQEAGGGDESVARLLFDMDEIKHQTESRRVKRDGGDSRVDEMSSVSNVTEGMSLDNSHGTEEPSSVLSDEAPSTTWKDIKIAKLLSELEQAKMSVIELEEREKVAQTQLSITEGKLLVASQETSDARKRQGAREVNLRDAIAQLQRLQGEYEQMKELVSSLQDQLEQAKAKARLAEQETKAARQRATGYHNQFKKLQDKHNEAMKLIEEQERQIEMLEHR